MPLPPKCASIEVSMGCAALILSYISYLGSRLWTDANSGVEVSRVYCLGSFVYSLHFVGRI